MPDIRAMCAIGRRGQLGLNGRMPWEGASGPEYTADVQRFFELTRGHVILLGPRTYRSVPAFPLRGPHRRRDTLQRAAARRDCPLYRPRDLHRWRTAGLDRLRPVHPLTRLPYDGAADRWFDPAWIVAG
jgi:dihydromethanopterin reductase